MMLLLQKKQKLDPEVFDVLGLSLKGFREKAMCAMLRYCQHLSTLERNTSPHSHPFPLASLLDISLPLSHRYASVLRFFLFFYLSPSLHSFIYIKIRLNTGAKKMASILPFPLTFLVTYVKDFIANKLYNNYCPDGWSYRRKL